MQYRIIMHKPNMNAPIDLIETLNSNKERFNIINKEQ